LEERETLAAREPPRRDFVRAETDLDLALTDFRAERAEALLAFGLPLTGATDTRERVRIKASDIERALSLGSGRTLIELPSWVCSVRFDARPDLTFALPTKSADSSSMEFDRSKFEPAKESPCSKLTLIEPGAANVAHLASL